jgi:hypothetical protein
MLYTMFKDIHFDVDAMLKAATKEPSSQNMESQGTPAGGSNRTGTTSGSRKRGRSGAAKSTTDSPAKPPAQPSSPASTLQPKAKKSSTRLWGGVAGQLRGKAEQKSSNMQKLVANLTHKKKEEAKQKYEHCLKLAKQAGITADSPEFCFLSAHLQKNVFQQSSFLQCESHEERRGWILQAFNMYQMEQRQKFDKYMSQQ